MLHLKKLKKLNHLHNLDSSIFPNLNFVILPYNSLDNFVYQTLILHFCHIIRLTIFLPNLNFVNLPYNSLDNFVYQTVTCQYRISFIFLGAKHNPTFSDKIFFLMLSTLLITPMELAAITFSRLLIFEPCAPVFLGSLLLPCEECGVLKTWSIARVIFPFVNLQTITVILAAVSFNVFYVYLTVVHCLLRYSQLLGAKPQQTLIYRELEILERMLNDYGQIRILPPALTIPPIIQITSIFVIIKMREEISFLGFLTFIVAFLSSFLCLVISETITGKLRTVSGNRLGVLSRNCGNSKYYRRKARSMRPLTTRFGTNFVDRKTALVTQNFCAEQTVSLLMLF